MRRLSYYLLLLQLCLLFAVLPAHAGSVKPDQARLQQLDQFAFNADARYTSDVRTLATYLSKGAKTDYEKARVIFAWVAKNIRYDDYGYNTGKFIDQKPESVLKNRRSVCDGYAQLYKALGEAMGLEVEKVSGYAKGYAYRPGTTFARTNHAWNAVKIDNRWILVDPTWAAGSATSVNGRLKTIYTYDPYWFDVEPHAFLFSHMPVRPEYQNISNPISLPQYQQLAEVDPSMFRLGIRGADVLQNLLSGKIKSLPETWKTDLSISFQDVPLTEKLQPGKLYTLSFTVADDVDIIVNNGKDWHHFTEKGNTRTLQIKPEIGHVAVMARKKGTKVNYSYFLQYKVER
ncbi:transglutaminase domain-containing protein [Pontibacter sp. H259]|uniref:transglutaminase domain-containing protein n=1 Tax=Pontibacter sp. H259 TaxID=3133421 RepID=UPI0030C2BEB3